MQRFPLGVRVCCIERCPQMGHFGGTSSLGPNVYISFLKRNASNRGDGQLTCRVHQLGA